MRGNNNTDGDDNANNLAKEFAMLRGDEVGGDIVGGILDKTADVVDFKCNNSNSGPLRAAVGGPNKAIRSFEAET